MGSHGLQYCKPSGLQDSGVSQGTFGVFYLWDPMVYNIVNQQAYKTVVLVKVHSVVFTYGIPCKQWCWSRYIRWFLRMGSHVNSGVGQGTFGGFYLWDLMVYNITTKPFSNYSTV